MNINILDRYFGMPVVMFHGLCRKVPEYALFSGGRTCLFEQDRFVELIEWISRHFSVVRLGDLEGPSPGRKGRPPIVLTFDDALASVIDLAVPVLEEYRMSAVVFVSVDWVESRRTPDIFLLEKAIWESLPLKLETHLKGKSLVLSLDSRQDAEKGISILWDALFTSRISPFTLNGCEISMNGKEWQRQETAEDRHFWFPASWEELKGAHASGAIEIGSHMISHVPLTFLPDDEKKYQLQHSRDRLADIFQVPISSCSYPHGIIDESALSLARDTYAWGFTNKPGRVGASTERLIAPRYHAPGESPRQIRDVLALGYPIGSVKWRAVNKARSLSRRYW